MFLKKKIIFGLSALLYFSVGFTGELEVSRDIAHPIISVPKSFLDLKSHPEYLFGKGQINFQSMLHENTMFLANHIPFGKNQKKYIRQNGIKAIYFKAKNLYYNEKLDEYNEVKVNDGIKYEYDELGRLKKISHYGPRASSRPCRIEYLASGGSSIDCTQSKYSHVVYSKKCVGGDAIGCPYSYSKKTFYMEKPESTYEHAYKNGTAILDFINEGHFRGMNEYFGIFKSNDTFDHGRISGYVIEDNSREHSTYEIEYRTENSVIPLKANRIACRGNCPVYDITKTLHWAFDRKKMSITRTATIPNRNLLGKDVTFIDKNGYIKQSTNLGVATIDERDNDNALVEIFSSPGEKPIFKNVIKDGKIKTIIGGFLPIQGELRFNKDGEFTRIVGRDKKGHLHYEYSIDHIDYRDF